MKVTGWVATLNGTEYGSDSSGLIYPEELREQVEMLSGREVTTSYGKVFTVEEKDPDGVLTLFQELFDPSNESEVTTEVEDESGDDDPEARVYY